MTHLLLCDIAHYQSVVQYATTIELSCILYSCSYWHHSPHRLCLSLERVMTIYTSFFCFFCTFPLPFPSSFWSIYINIVSSSSLCSRMLILDHPPPQALATSTISAMYTRQVNLSSRCDTAVSDADGMSCIASRLINYCAVDTPSGHEGVKSAIPSGSCHAMWHEYYIRCYTHIHTQTHSCTHTHTPRAHTHFRSFALACHMPS